MNFYSCKGAKQCICICMCNITLFYTYFVQGQCLLIWTIFIFILILGHLDYTKCILSIKENHMYICFFFFFLFVLFFHIEKILLGRHCLQKSGMRFSMRDYIKLKPSVHTGHRQMLPYQLALTILNVHVISSWK